MSNVASDQLFRLIRSLSKPEKRYFKLYSSRHILGEVNNYQLLFDAIDKMKEYDESRLHKKFAGQAFLRQLSIAKRRLYDHILYSLDAYHAHGSIDSELRRLVNCALILYKRSLYSQAAKLLKSARKLAERYDKHTILLDISLLEKKLIETGNYTRIDEEDLLQIQERDRLTLEKISNLNEFWHIKSRMFYILNRRGKARNQEELSNFKAIIDNVLLRSEDKALYPKTKYLYHHIYSAYYFGTGDYSASFQHLKKNVALVESEVAAFKEEPNVYFSLLTNIIYIASRLRRYPEVFFYLEKLRALPEKLSLQRNEDLDIKLFSSTYSLELTLYAFTGDFEKGIALVPFIREGLALYGEKINTLRRAYLYFSIAILYLGEKHYSEALNWINLLLATQGLDKTEDIYCFAQLVNLIIHLELGSQRLLPYTLKSTQRYLSSRNRVYKFESAMLNFVNKIIRTRDRREEQKVYALLLEELRPLEQETFEKSAFEHFDFVAWAESKVTGKPFRDIIRERASAAEGRA